MQQILSLGSQPIMATRWKNFPFEYTRFLLVIWFKEGEVHLVSIPYTSSMCIYLVCSISSDKRGRQEIHQSTYLSVPDMNYELAQKLVITYFNMSPRINIKSTMETRHDTPKYSWVWRPSFATEFIILTNYTRKVEQRYILGCDI